MDHLYYYLLNKGHTGAEAEETIYRLEYGFYIPEEISKDIKEYYKSWIKENPNTLF